MSNPQVAQTIINQLGGQRFMVMTGAKNLMYDNTSLYLRIGTGAKKGINSVCVKLEVDDTYTMEFSKIRGIKVADISKHEGIYCDQLQEIFTQETGFYTTL